VRHSLGATLGLTASRGESGAGKTENTKKVIQFLTAIAADASSSLPSSGSADSVSHEIASGSLSRSASRSALPDKKLGQLERQILQANPILEAFGNAQTVRNNNSSRFGKFVRIEFSANGAIAGAFIDWYLLEKSRVTSRAEQERSFHVFYELLRGASDKLKRDLLLDRPVEGYGYLAISSKQVDGLDDAEEWRILERAFAIVGFTAQEQLNVLKVIAAILHLGNIEVGGTDRAVLNSTTELEKAAHLLGLPVKEFNAALVSPRTRAGREWVTQSRTRQQVIDEIASVCKTLYEKNFGAIVDRINRALERQTVKSTFIGVLDIAGFEIFQRNSFEQLCINYTNEKLQQFFNHHMFVLEQEEYEREEIGWQFENFGLDLQPTIDLIESSQPIGILACLDEECIMPKASDETFLEKLKTLYTNRSPMLSAEKATPASKFSVNRNERLNFSVQHYAGKVDYSADDWLSKNKDPLNENLASVLAASSDAYVAGLFTDSAEPVNGARRAVVKRGAFRTVGQRHKEQLHFLMTQLQSTSPHFVRCIVPNPFKRPAQISIPLVLDQLRCNGVLEGIRIARLGYPNRLPFIEFRHRYEVLTPTVVPKGYVDGRKACQSMLAALKLDPTEFKVGRTKAFFKAGVLADLEVRRDELLYGIFSRIQAACRRFSARRSLLKVLNRAMATRTIQRNARIYLTLKDWPWWSLYTRVRPLLAATRADEELRRKEAELALAREREQRDAQEKLRLAQMQLKADQEKKVLQEAFDRERLSREEQDEQLKRIMDRERILQEVSLPAFAYSD
jgi:myosin protein heavy chain